MEVNQANSSYYLSNKPQREPVKTLDKDAFLQIMIAQLRYQDPSSPMDSGKFIEQMAMFTTLEQMTNMSKNMEKLYSMQELNYASSLIGRQVTLLTDEEQVMGEVKRVTMGEAGINIWVSNKPYSMEQVIAVEGRVSSEPEELPTDPVQQPDEDTADESATPGEETGADQPSEPTEPSEPGESTDTTESSEPTE